jgi:hypothetical protein
LIRKGRYFGADDLLRIFAGGDFHAPWRIQLRQIDGLRAPISMPDRCN